MPDSSRKPFMERIVWKAISGNLCLNTRFGKLFEENLFGGPFGVNKKQFSLKADHHANPRKESNFKVCLFGFFWMCPHPRRDISTHTMDPWRVEISQLTMDPWWAEIPLHSMDPWWSSWNKILKMIAAFIQNLKRRLNSTFLGAYRRRRTDRDRQTNRQTDRRKLRCF